MGARKMDVHYASGTQNWGTPGPVFDPLFRCLRFTVDVCADAKNAKVPRYYDRKADGLRQSWKGETWWCNPPYENVDDWTRKGRREALRGSTGMFLVPARVDTRWWNENLLGPAGRLVRSYFVPQSRVWWHVWADLIVGVHFVEGRIPFVLPGKPKPGAKKQAGAPFPTALVLLEPTARRLRPPRVIDSSGLVWDETADTWSRPFTYRRPA